MKKRTFISVTAFVAALFIFSGVGKVFAQEQEIQKGDTATVLGMEYVEVKNLEPIGNYSYGSACSTDSGDIISVIGIDGSRILVAYTKNGTSAYSCPSGTIFFIEKERFFKMKSDNEKAKQKETAEKELIRRLLENK